MTTLADPPIDSTRPPAERQPELSARAALLAVMRWVATNRLFTAALAVAAALRVVVMVGYPPALEFFGDSPAYLQASDHLDHIDVWHPIGYPLLLRVISVTGSLAVLTAAQHLLGLLAAVLVYRLLRRLGPGPVIATVAALPLLVDAYQLDVEQFVLSDTLFTVLLVATLAVAVRLRERPGMGPAVGLGLLLAALTLTRTVGLAVVVAVAVFLLVQRIGGQRLVAAGIAVALPVGAYALAFRATYGAFGLQGYSGRYLYGTVAPYVDCHDLSVPSAQRVLCPRLPTYARPGLNQFVWQMPPYLRLPGSQVERSQVAGDFARSVFMHQPVTSAGVIVGNIAHYFAPGRPTDARDWFVGSWQFPLPARSPAWNISPASVGFHQSAVEGRIDVGVAHFLRGYQDIVYTPGPVLLLAVLATGLALVLRRSSRDARQVAGLLTGTGLLLLAVPAATAGFDWRYLLPAQAVLLPGGLLAAHSVGRRLAAGWSPRWRRLSTGAAAAVAVVLAVPPGSVYAAAPLSAGHPAPVPAVVGVGSHLRVGVGRPVGLKTQCATVGKRHRVLLLARFPASVTRRSGGTFLAEPSNFAVAGQDPFDSVVLPDRPLLQLLPTALLSARYPKVAGNLYVWLRSTSGRLLYVDPRGGGAAAWSFRVPLPPGMRVPGSRCTPPPPPLPSPPRVAHLAPFSESTTAVVGYGPATYLPSPGTTYDVRWRQAAPTGRPGGWQYPAAWQQSSVMSQSLSGLAAGVTYCFSVRAHRPTGTVTSWSLPHCTTRLTDDSRLVAGPPWRHATGAAGFYLGTYTSTVRAGASLVVTGLASRVAVVAYRCPTCGALDVYLGKHRIKRLHLAGPAGLRLWKSLPLARSRMRTLRLVAVRNALVAVDAVALQRGPIVSAHDDRPAGAPAHRAATAG